jgi:hypothetical protein
MPKYLVTAISKFTYLVPVKAANEEEALAELDDYIASELADYQEDAVWTYEVEEVFE